ncbi:MAG: hypothetical protein MSG78_08640, partial [Clostridiales bacterium]|nr:hypothetical protein [Clostridiales bacterium]
VRTTPGQTTPVQTTPGQTTPEQTTPEQTTSEQTTPVQTTPEQTTPEQTTPVQTTEPTITEEQKVLVSLFNGKTLQIKREINESELPENFIITTYSYKGNEIQVAEDTNGLILFYLIDDGETANFYIFSEEKDSCIPYVKINSSSNQYIFLDLEEGSEELKDLTATKISVNGKTLPAWKPTEGDTPKEDYIVYLMNQQNERALYHVNISTGVIEPYNGQSLDPANQESQLGGETVGDDILQEDTSDRDALLRKIAIIGGGIVGITVLLAAGICLYNYLKKKTKHSEEEDLYDNEDDLYLGEDESDGDWDSDEEIDRELAALEQQEWNKGNFDDEEEVGASMPEQAELPEDELEPDIDMEALNKVFNDMAAEKKKQSDVNSLNKSAEDHDSINKSSGQEKRNLEEALNDEDDDDFEVTDFR